MKIKDIVGMIYSKVAIYEHVDDEDQMFRDIYKGLPKNIPWHVMEMEVRIIAAARKGVVEIKVDPEVSE